MGMVNTKLRGILGAFLLASVFCVLFSNNSYAAVPYQKSYTDANGVTWYVTGLLDAGGPVNMTISYNGATNASSITTLHIPSYNELTSNLDFAGREVEDTYILGGVPDPQLVGAELTSLEKIDFTDAAKIQIRDITSIMDGVSNEVELVFGDDVVIADPVGTTSTSSNGTGAFEGYDLKLTNLDKVKYIGWNAFKGATFNSASREITINSNQTIGGHTFEGTNVTKMTLNTAEVGEAICLGCTDLTSVTFGDNVTKLYGSAFEGTTALAQNIDFNNIAVVPEKAFKNSAITGVTLSSAFSCASYQAFMNTNLGSVDLGNNSPTIGYEAFYNAGLNSVDFGNVRYMAYQAFANNNLTSVDLPKSLRISISGPTSDFPGSQTGAEIFSNNPLKDLTIRFDYSVQKYNGATTMPLPRVLGTNTWGNYIETVKVFAPYAENESAASDHDNSYWMNNNNNGMYVPNSYITNLKNVIPNNMFDSASAYGLNAKPKTFYIDDRYEMFGALSFYDTTIAGLYTMDANGNASSENGFPSKLKAIGANAFLYAMYMNDQLKISIESLPSEIEYIGATAFGYCYHFNLNTFDLPNLKFFGEGAFYQANVKNIHLREFTSNSLSRVHFLGSDSIDTIIVDYDIFGPSHNSTGQGFADMFGGWFSSQWMKDTHMKKIVFTEKAISAPSANPFKFQKIDVEELDLSATPWKNFGSNARIFVDAKIGTLKLPSQLEVIGEECFLGAEITNPVTIPNTVTRIESRAFSAKSRTTPSGVHPGVSISQLPDSIEYIGDGAFYLDTAFTADVDLPNLTYLGSSAFHGSGITGIKLSDSIQTLGYNALYGANNLKDVTIDMDLYSVTRTYDDGDYCFQQNGESCPSELTEDQKNVLRNANYYDSFISTFGKNANYGTVTFTEKAGTPCGGNLENCQKNRPYFYGIKAEKVDLSATNWTYIAPSMFQAAKVGEIVLPNSLVTIGEDAFFRAEMNSTILPASLKTIGVEAFQWAKARIDQLPEGLKTIDDSAFYEADVTDDLVIPAGITKIGKDAFNANSEDIHYNSITLKGDLTYTITSDQPIFVVFYNAVVDKMIVESADLPALHANDGIPEFHAMRMKEVVLTKLPEISANAFEECDRLEKVDARADSALRAIDDEAFINDVKLKSFLFSTGLKNETVTIGKRAFQGTAFETMGDSSKDFDLTAANFEAMDGYAFSGMPKLRTVDIPRNFSHATIPVATFYNDTALEEATLDYKITLMDDAAFAQDVKLKRIFIWGNTVVKDETLDGYTEPAYYGHGGPSGGSTRGAGLGVTIPENTDIYAYSTSPTESYAAYDGRDDFDGTFYPLDEVIYLTSNNPTVLINEDSTDFDKSDLIVYGLRRDGVVLESDSWQQFDGKVYARSAKPLTFEKMAATIAANPAFGTVYDTPVPINELSLENENFANIGFELVPSEDDPSIRVVNIIYTDAYTDGKPDTDIDPYREPEPAPTPAPKPDKKTNPDTSSDNMGKYFAILVGCTGAAAAAIAASRLRKKISL